MTMQTPMHDPKPAETRPIGAETDELGFPMTPPPLLADDDAYRAHRAAGTLGENQAVRLLRAKAAELEHRPLASKTGDGAWLADLTDLARDLALIATLLADDIEYRHTGRPVSGGRRP
jgi:hypothetical protein